MSLKPPLIFWQNIASPHQLGLLSTLSALWRNAGNGDTILACERYMSPERRRQGWQVPHMNGVEILSLEDGHTFETLKSRFFEQGATHVCSGFHSIPLAWRALCDGTRLGERVFVMAERPRSTPRTHLAKSMLYRFHAARFARRLDGVMAYGDLGAAYYRSAGFSSVHTIGYTVVNDIPLLAARLDNPTAVNLLFVGSQLHLKGLDRLLEALGDPSFRACPGWRLAIVTGDDADRYRQLATHHGIAASLDWYGPMPNAEVRAMMAASDALVLPSRYDGWGAVVNEALHAGARVIVSDRCGSSCVIRDRSIGHVFQGGSLPALRAGVSEAIRQGPLSADKRAAIARWSQRAISADAMARFVFDILKENPGRGALKPPWTYENRHRPRSPLVLR
jgi:glycosyltransferase involved in cell wall biosynthesis